MNASRVEENKSLELLLFYSIFLTIYVWWCLTILFVDAVFASAARSHYTISLELPLPTPQFLLLCGYYYIGCIFLPLWLHLDWITNSEYITYSKMFWPNLQCNRVLLLLVRWCRIGQARAPVQNTFQYMARTRLKAICSSHCYCYCYCYSPYFVHLYGLVMPRGGAPVEWQRKERVPIGVWKWKTIRRGAFYLLKVYFFAGRSLR